MDTMTATQAIVSEVAAAPVKARWRWLPLVTAAAVTVVVLLATHTAVVDIARYAGYWAWSIVLPGTLVYRALRRKAHSLVDDLAMGAALGLALEIAAMALLSVTGLRALIPVWPVLAILPTLAIPAARRRLLARGGIRPSLAWSWSVVGVYLFLLGYLTGAFLVPVDVHPATAQAYHIDLVYFLSIMGESKHHFPLETPWTAGDPLSYHWFSYAHMGMGSLVSGVDAPTVLFRLALPPLFALAVVLMSVVGWRVSARPWVGVGAAALTFVVGEASIGSLATGTLGGEVAYTLWSSPSVVYSYVVGLAIIVLMVDQLRREPDTYLKAGPLALLAIFVLAAPGAKSTVVPVTLCAVGLVCLVQLLTRRFTVFPWLAAGLLLVAQLLALAVLYRFQSFGVAVAPLRTVRDMLPPSAPCLLGAAYTPTASCELSLAPDPTWPAWRVVVAYVTALAGIGIYWGARLAGIPVAWWSRHGKRGLTEWFLLGGLVGGFVAVLVLSHPSLSQLFILRSGILFGTLLSAMGVAAVVDRLSIAPRTFAALAVGAAAIVVAVWGVLCLKYGAEGNVNGDQFFRVFRLALALGAIVLAILVAGLFLGRRHPRWRAHSRMGALLVILTAGLMGLPADAHSYPNMRGFYHQNVSAVQQEAAAWIRTNTSADDLLATNEHCVAPPPYEPPYNQCLNLSYWLSAWSERRVLLESWGYGVETRPFGPYPDMALQTSNDEVFSNPTQATLAWMLGRGVRTLVVDRRFGTESPQLATFAQLRWQRDYLAIYTLA